jgi:hypothetical protein
VHALLISILISILLLSVPGQGLAELCDCISFRRTSNLAGVAFAEVDSQPSCMSDVRADEELNVPCDDKEIGKRSSTVWPL